MTDFPEARTGGVARNPILPGFNPDPSIVRRGEDFYLATSTFEWYPGVLLHHSKDLVRWDVVGSALTERHIDLRGVASSGGVWAPCLTVHPMTGRFHLVYSVMKSQVSNHFDVDNYLVTSDDIAGPWSDPTYLTSIGFDASLFHDDDGSTWLVTLEWETRPDHEHPGWIVLQSVDDKSGAVGHPVRIHRGSSDRGAMEAPHLYKIGGKYYLMTAEGGTGFGHGAFLARSPSITGPYTPDPRGAIVTSQPTEYQGRGNRDFLRPEWFNPEAVMQKAGHASLVEAADGSWWLVHLASRPQGPEHRSPLGRETSLQRVEWTDDGWLRLRGVGVLPAESVSIPFAEPSATPASLDVETDFGDGLGPRFAVPRGPIDSSWLRTGADGLTLRGRDSLHSHFDVSLVATRLTGFTARASTAVAFSPEHFSQHAGLSLFYDGAAHVSIRVGWSEGSRQKRIMLVRAHGGPSLDQVLAEAEAPLGEVELAVDIDAGTAQFSYRRSDQAGWTPLGESVLTDYMSDEARRGFTGQFVGVAVSDGLSRKCEATFRRFSLRYPPAR